MHLGSGHEQTTLSEDNVNKYNAILLFGLPARVAIMIQCCLVVSGCALAPQDEDDFNITPTARCAGNGNRAVSNLIVNGTTFVTEIPDATCNGNNQYSAQFLTPQGGWRATVWIQNNDVWVPYPGGYDTQLHSYAYSDNNSSSLISLCADNHTTYFCGWGTSWNMGSGPNVSIFATNFGF